MRVTVLVAAVGLVASSPARIPTLEVVVVAGAGSDEVNGRYVAHGKYGGTTQFELHKGGRVFELFNIDNQSGWWNILERLDGARVHYGANEQGTTAALPLPPSRGWASAQHNSKWVGRAPNPTVQIVPRTKHFEDEHDADVYNKIGLVHLKRRGAGGYDAALSAFEASIELDPAKGYVWMNKGLALSGLKRLQEEMDAYREALQRGYGAAQVHNNVGMLLRKQGRHHEAMASVRRAAELEPAMAYVIRNLGMLCDDQGDTSDAARHYKRAYRLERAAGEGGAALRAPLVRAVLHVGEREVVASMLQSQAAGEAGELDWAWRLWLEADTQLQLAWRRCAGAEPGCAAAARKRYAGAVRGTRERFNRQLLNCARAANTQEGRGTAHRTSQYNRLLAQLLKNGVCAAVDHTLDDKGGIFDALRVGEARLGGASGTSGTPGGVALALPFDVDSFHMQTFTMPAGRAAFLAAAAGSPGAMWLRKPLYAADGEGVGLVDSVEEAAQLPAGWLLQRYLSHPLLLNGHKFDLRVFVTVASVAPLRVYAFRQVYAKVASAKYSLDDTGDRNKHFTNLHLDEKGDAAGCHIATGERVFEAINARDAGSRGGERAAQRVWRSITETAARVVSAGVLQLPALLGRAALEGMPPPLAFCPFKTYGMDFILSDDLHVWFVEANANSGFDAEVHDRCDEPPLNYEKMARDWGSLFMRGGGGTEADASVADEVAASLGEEAAAYPNLRAELRSLAREYRARGDFDLIFPAVARGGGEVQSPEEAARWMQLLEQPLALADHAQQQLLHAVARQEAGSAAGAGDTTGREEL
eukprot:g956.t1